MTVNHNPISTEVITYLKRARALEGMSLHLLYCYAKKLQPNLPVHKGSIGICLELAINLCKQTLAGPDVPHLGLEIKSFPVKKETYQATSSLFICSASTQEPLNFKDSFLSKKLDLVLCVPYSGSLRLPWQHVYIGKAFIWQPSTDFRESLRRDWTELSQSLRLGEHRKMTAQLGSWIQLRPKAANNHDTSVFIDRLGYHDVMKRYGFYMRRIGVQRMLDEADTMLGEWNSS